MINRELIEPFSKLELLAKQVVEGFITGLHKSPFHGFSVEFAEHRIYNKGESTKHIDWKLFGKTDKLFIKRYEEETNLRCQIIIDTSNSMLFPLERKQDAMNKLSTGKGNLLRRVEKMKELGLSASKVMNAKLLERAQVEEI